MLLNREISVYGEFVYVYIIFSYIEELQHIWNTSLFFDNKFKEKWDGSIRNTLNYWKSIKL